jgi:hypothetical protein
VSFAEEDYQAVRAFRKFVWDQALVYLQERAGMEAIRRHMALSEGYSPRSFAEVYQRLLDSLSNRQGMPNSIGSVQRLGSVLIEFDFNRVLAEYRADWGRLFEEIRTKIRPTSRMDPENSHNYWTIFCNGAISAAEYLRQFDSLQDFLTLVRDFDSKPTTRPALPPLLEKEIFGLGFALACDFLKELGFTNYSKPDVHLLDIFSALDIARRSQLAVFRAIALMAAEVNETPYAVDKAFWLIGSGRLYMDNVNFTTDKREFVERVSERWQKAKATAMQP